MKRERAYNLLLTGVADYLIYGDYQAYRTTRSGDRESPFMYRDSLSNGIDRSQVPNWRAFKDGKEIT